MIKVFKYGLGVSIVLLLLSSCLSGDQSRYEPLPDKLTVNMYEELGEDGRNFYIIVETEEVYECSNYIIDFSTSVTADTVVEVRLKEIFKPNTCYTERGTAKGVLWFGVDDWHEQRVRFITQNESVDAIVGKDTSQYVLNMNDTEHIVKSRDILKRVPENTIWGIVEYNKLESEAIIDTFKMALDTIGAIPVILEDGDYEFFKIMDGELVDPGSTNAKYNQVFIRYYDGDFGNIKNIANYAWYRTNDIGSSTYSSRAESYRIGYY